MAPNQKHHIALGQTFDLDLVHPTKAGFPPLTSEVAQQSQKVTTEAPQQDSSDYWEWSADNDAEINSIVDEERLSPDHIVANMLRQPAAPASSTLAVNDQYWDWSHAKKESTHYWNWTATIAVEQEITLPASAAETESFKTTNDIMAPNLKHRSSLLQTFDLYLVQPVKTVFPPFTRSEVEHVQPQQVIKPPQQDSSDYREWSSDHDKVMKEIVDEERLSADHNIANILRQPVAKASTLLADNDQYWDWHHAKKETTDYWNWQATNGEQGTTVLQGAGAETDSYWAW
ncbi:MAG: hypothetical protein SGBAC_013424 [Bacillariaceae sp.]